MSPQSYVMLLVLIITTITSSTSNPIPSASNGPFYPHSYKGPVIGVLTQKTNGKMTSLGHSYLAASYVKYLESAGAQVLPVFDSVTKEELDKTLGSLNGMLLPGGAQRFTESSYYQVARYVYEWTVQRNQNGTYFPLWGTCLGFEAILDIAANTTDIRYKCSAHGANNLTILSGAQNSKMLYNLDDRLYEDVLFKPQVYNAHDYCISPHTMLDMNGVLYDKFSLLAVNWDNTGREYAALVEHRSLPIYGSQFHPEKNAFEWTPYSDIPHSASSIQFTQYLANFFVGEVRKNGQRFASSEEFYKRNINNYHTVYTQIAINSTLESCYFFNDTRNDLSIDTSD